MVNRARHPAGVPAGGQFAPTCRPESDMALLDSTPGPGGDCGPLTHWYIQLQLDRSRDVLLDDLPYLHTVTATIERGRSLPTEVRVSAATNVDGSDVPVDCTFDGLEGELNDLIDVWDDFGGFPEDTHEVELDLRGRHVVVCDLDTGENLLGDADGGTGDEREAGSLLDRAIGDVHERALARLRSVVVDRLPSASKAVFELRLDPETGCPAGRVVRVDGATGPLGEASWDPDVEEFVCDDELTALNGTSGVAENVTLLARTVRWREGAEFLWDRRQLSVAW